MSHLVILHEELEILVGNIYVDVPTFLPVLLQSLLAA